MRFVQVFRGSAAGWKLALVLVVIAPGGFAAGTADARDKAIELMQLLVPDPVGDRRGGNQFGHGIAVDGQRALIAAPRVDVPETDAGMVFVMEFDETRWQHTATLQASDARADARFGRTLDLQGDTAVVSTINSQSEDETPGTIYVFDFDGATWTETQRLTLPANSGITFFGLSLSLDQDRLLAGSLPVGSAGAAHLFQRGLSGWSLSATLTADDGEEDDRFGAAVGLDGDTAMVGAHFHEQDGLQTGAAYVYQLTSGGWQQVQKLVPPVPGSFGFSLELQGDRALIGASADSQLSTLSGAAYVFQRNSDRWAQTAKLLPSEPLERGQFGSRVALDGPRALISAYEPDNGATAYLLEFNGNAWTERTKLTAQGEDDRFHHVAIDGSLALLGAPQDDGDHPNSLFESGAVFAFTERNGEWSVASVVPQPRIPGADEAWYGRATVLGEDWAMVGAPGEKDSGMANGAVYVYQRDSEDWRFSSKLSVPGEGDWFGFSLALEDDRLLVSAPNDDTMGDDAGAVYAYRRDGKAWTQQAKLLPPDSMERQRFGTTMAFHGDEVLIAAQEYFAQFDRFGRVHVYENVAGKWSRTGELISSHLEVNDDTGSALALGDNVALVGAPNRSTDREAEFPDREGAVEVFERSNGVWQSVDQWRPTNPGCCASLGVSVALDGDVAMVGDPFSPGRGRAYVYRREATGWRQSQMLPAPDDEPGALFFGQAIALDGPRAIITATTSTNRAADRGVAHSFEFRGVSWVLADRYEAADSGLLANQFGFRDAMVSLSGNQALIGAPANPRLGYEAGVTYALMLDEPLGDRVFGNGFE